MAEMSRPGLAGAGKNGDDGLLPKHHRVYLILRQEIEDGVYADAATMAGELALAERFDVSRITVRKAMDRLTQEGWVERQRGRGTFVRTRAAPSHVGASLSGNIENLVAMGLQTDVELIELTYAVAPGPVCAMMGAAPGTVMQRAVRVRSHEGVPFSHLTTWLPEDIGRSFTAEEMQRTPLLRLIERAGHRIATARQAITAKLATPEVARLLGIEPGEALLSVRRQVYDDAGQLVEYISGLYRPDTYEHEMEYDRSRTSAADFWTTKDTTTGAVT
ncbi:GntR family transcriptional regulator [Pseudooceanicola sediminis]|uniref:GntR family transcriptional regulator n=1 Tax=Pseudooceanicola sediminis TaxID=2211117 RepID=A0A399IYU2_9RHOB|nr:GntR family transcriptional regulator [Pseudooceanicola sediminis]KAA2312973.1 GntR family transcriptional regulator [Puniceibacterium sp. HSS470]RII37627.1 GntR family transcriptional regulator [Pseudooceanicola sediminis]|tara:strand:+ start:32399 stop:33223 length:825 start_codon:yes stop_codon:yes gene_type:complete